MNCLVNYTRSTRRFVWTIACGLAAFSVVFVSSAQAAPPKVARLSVRGLQIAATTRIVLTGADLLPDLKLLCDAPIKSQQIVGKPTATSVEVDVAIDGSAVPGVYHLRVQSAGGVTPPELIAIDGLKHQPVATAIDTLPTAVHGALAGSTVQEFTFPGTVKSQVTVDVLARRLGSKLRPVIHLYDADRRQLAWSLPLVEYGCDARLTAVLPNDGRYTIKLHDLTYAAAAPAHYCVAVGTFDQVDQVYPLAVSRQSPASVELIGRLPEKTVRQIDPAALMKLLGGKGRDVASDALALPWPANAHPFGLRPRLMVSDLPELAEESLSDGHKLPTSPVAVSGRIAREGEEDIFQIDVAAGDQIRCELLADRLGSPMDATLELRDAKGARLMLVDDVVGPDPRIDYTVPANLTKVSIVVGEALRRGGANLVYRLVVTPRNGAAVRGDFKLKVIEDTQLITSQRSRVFRVEAERNGYEGAIRVTVAGLPKGVESSPVEIAAGADAALVELRGKNSTDASSVSTMTVQGESVEVEPKLVRTAGLATHPLADSQPWLKYDLAVANLPASKETLSVDWDKSSTEAPLLLGLDHKVKLRIERGIESLGPVRLTLVTSQLPVIVNNQPSAASMLRGTTPTVDVPLNGNVRTAVDALAAADKALADVEKRRPKSGEVDTKLMAELEKATKVRDDAAKRLDMAKERLRDSLDYVLVVPADLKTVPYDLSIRAELLSADSRTTLAEAFSPPLRLAVRPPFEIAQEGLKDNTIKLDPKSGASITLAGTLKRLGEFKGETTVTLSGLPTGVTVPRATLKAAESNYKLEFKLPANFAADKLDGIKLVATATPDARRANVTVRGEMSVAPIQVVKEPPAEKPAAK